MHLHNSTSRPTSHPDLGDEEDGALLYYASMRGEDLNARDQAVAEEAFVVLYNRHAKAVLRLLRNSGEGQVYERDGSQNLESLVAQVFLRACDQAETYDSEKSQVKTWLVGIAKNLIRSWIRSEKRRRNVSGRLTPNKLGPDERDPLTTEDVLADLDVFSEDEINILRDALETAITDREWELLTRYLAVQSGGGPEGRAERGSAQRLADILDTSTNNLRTTKSRALSKLKAYVQEHMPERVPE